MNPFKLVLTFTLLGIASLANAAPVPSTTSVRTLNKCVVEYDTHTSNLKNIAAIEYLDRPIGDGWIRFQTNGSSFSFKGSRELYTLMVERLKICIE